jgi:hypothetical protein
MRKVVPLLLVLAALPAQAKAQEIVLEAGTELETRVDGDLNGDDVNDIAFVAYGEDSRALTVLLSNRTGEFDVEYAPEVLVLEPTMLGPGALTIEQGVLRFEDLTGGTTAVSSIRRFRYDAMRKQMRMIGLDATLYSRTNAHDGFEMSWNLLNGDAVTSELRLAEGAGEDPYEKGQQRRFKYRVRPQWLSDAPDPETMIEEMRQS